jgi:glycosyltransferase involved in cell wall biosynthesis
VRQRLAPDGERLVAHFGTHSPLVTALLDSVLERVLDSRNARVVLIGRNSERYVQSFVARRSRFNGRLAATGVLQPGDLSKHLQACDVLLQPYPDGVSTRRTTTIAGLAHGRAIVTNEGALSEPLWRESGAVALCSSPDAALLADEVAALLADDRRRSALAARARQLYDGVFDIRHALGALTGPGELSALACSENLAS